MNFMRAMTSQDFFDFVRSIGEAKSKQEEDTIILSQMEKLKKLYQQSGHSEAFQKELLMRVLYVAMLGHDTSFGQIHAIKLCASSNVLYKRVGYLVSSSIIEPAHPLRLMIVNQLQRDLSSPNFLIATAALSALNSFLTEEMLASFQTQIVGLLHHENLMVRKKTLAVIHKIVKHWPDWFLGRNQIISMMLSFIRNLQFGLIPPTLSIFAELLETSSSTGFDSESLTELISALHMLLVKILDHCVPNIYMYHKVPAPFIQIKVLRLISKLISFRKFVTKELLQTVSRVLDKNKPVMTSMSLSISFESIYCLSEYNFGLDRASEVIELFLRHKNPNIRLSGLDALRSITKHSTKCFKHFQGEVVECLYSADKSLQKKAIILLCSVMNESNFESVLSHLLVCLVDTNTEASFRKLLVASIIEVSERCAPNEEAFVNVFFSLLQSAPDNISKSSVDKFLLWLRNNSNEETTTKAVKQAEILCMKNESSLSSVVEYFLLCMYGMFNHATYSMHWLDHFKSFRGYKENEISFVIAEYKRYIKKYKSFKFPKPYNSLLTEYSNSQDIELARLASILTKLSSKNRASCDFVAFSSISIEDMLLDLASGNDFFCKDPDINDDSYKRYFNHAGQVSLLLNDETNLKERYAIQLDPESASEKKLELVKPEMKKEFTEDLLLDLSSIAPISNLNTRKLSFSLCPAHLDVSEIGTCWSNLVAEKRASIKCIDFLTIVNTIKAQLDMAEIQILEDSKEVIFSASIQSEKESEEVDLIFGELNSPTREMVLLHIQIKTGHTQLIIRSNYEGHNDEIASLLQNAL